MIHSNVSIRERVTIGDRVILQNGVVIGGDGYGFVAGATGRTKIPQTAAVVIEDDVELGANTTVDRPAVGETRIKAGTKIDNLVQIAHGVTVGRNVLMAAQVGIAGSTEIGDEVMFGGQVGVGGHLTVGRGAIAVGQSGVTNSLDAGVMVAGYPAIDSREWRKASVLFRRLPELKRRIEELEARLAALTGQTPKSGQPDSTVNRIDSRMTRTFITTVLMTAWAASAAAQTTGSGVSFFLRSQFHVGAEHLTGIDDRRFRWDVNVGAEIDLMDYTAGRFIFAANYQAILGEELQKFDPNQGNYILLGALTARLRQTEAALVFYHQSRHLGDRPKTQPVDWNMLGGRVRRGFLVGTTYLDARADLRWTVQRSFVDYEWEIDSQVRADRRLRPDIGLWGAGGVRFSALTAVPAGTGKRATGPKVGSGSREAAAPSSCLWRPSAGSIPIRWSLAPPRGCPPASGC